jgi:hypothetical protein
MPPKADINQKDWEYHFERRARAAIEGRHLPTLDELYCGMSLFNDSVTSDAKDWSKRFIPCLAEKGQEMPRNPAQIALERLTVSASLEDLRLAHDELIHYQTSSEKSDEIENAISRLIFYRVARADISALRLFYEELTTRLHRVTGEFADVRRPPRRKKVKG